MAWNVKESEQSVNRQLVFRRKEMASQIVTTKKGSGQIFVLNRPDSVAMLDLVFLSTSRACVTWFSRSAIVMWVNI